MAEGLGIETDKLYGFLDTNRELSPSQIDYEVGAFAPILLSEGLNTVLIRFTPEQYKWLLSSAITGAYIIYPENPLNAVFPLLECLDMPINDCEQVANCIENNPATREALSDWFRDSDYNEALERALEGLTSPGTGYSPGGGCDEDALFGSVTAVFDELNQSAVDFLEILDASTQVVELLSEWGEELVALSIASGGSWAVVTGVLAVISTVVEQFITDLIQNYQAAFTSELRDELRCEFFCYALNNNCGYTANDILTWLEPQIAFSADDLLDLISWFFGLTIDISRQMVLRMWYLELALYKFAITNTLASIFAGQTAKDAMVRLTKVSQAANPDPDWMIICDACSVVPTFSWTYTNLSTPVVPPVGWTFTHDRPLISGPGNFRGYGQYRGAPSPQQLSTLDITITFPRGTLNTLRLRGFANSTTSSYRRYIVKAFDGATEVYTNTSTLPNANNVQTNFTINEDCTRITIRLEALQTFSGVCLYQIAINT